MYDGAIFDKDGVLLDSGLNNFLWMDRERMKEARKRGFDCSMDDAILVATGGKDEIMDMLDSKGMSFSQLLDVEEKVQDAKIEMIGQGYIRLFPGAHRVLENVDVAGLATNAPRKATEFTLDFFSLGRHFDCVRSVELEEDRLIRRRKPKPQMLEEVIDELGIENPVMIGDSSSDVHATENAGIDSILVESYSKSNGLDPTHRVRTVEEALDILR